MTLARGAPAAAALSLAALSVLGACTLLREVDDLEPGSSAASDAGGRRAQEAGTCPAEMVEERFPDGFRYCIDRTEVTQGAYAAFLASDAGKPVPAKCEGNTSLRPDEPTPQPEIDCESTYDPVARAALPVVCVDHCDAMTFCEARGARLCRGKDGAPLEQNAINDPGADEWYRACSGGKRAFPTGEEPSGCVVAATAPEAASSQRCATPEGALHLSGNVAEWTDICGEVPATGGFRCVARGGSFRDTLPKEVRCEHAAGESSKVREPSFRSAFIGFRCCRSL